MPVRAIKNSNGDWVVTDGDKTYGNHGKDEKKAHRQASRRRGKYETRFHLVIPHFGLFHRKPFLLCGLEDRGRKANG